MINRPMSLRAGASVRASIIASELSDLTSDDSSEPELLVNEEKSHADNVDIEGFIKKITQKPLVERVSFTVATVNSFIYPLLFINFMRTFWSIQSEMLHELQTNIYYRCVTNPSIQTALTYDGATVRAEGAGLTTTSAVVCGMIATVELTRLAAKYVFDQYHYAKNPNLIKRIEAFVQTRALNNIDYEKKLRAFLFTIPYKGLMHFLDIYEDLSGMDEEIITELLALSSHWEKFAAELAWYKGELNTNYLAPIVGLSTIPAFIVTYIAAVNLSKHSTCKEFPLLTYLTDACEVNEQYENLSLITYFWDILSATGLAVYCLGLFARLVTSPMKDFRLWFYENIHKKYFASDADKWIYKNIAWGITSYIVTPAIFAYSFTRAVTLANRYSELTNCPPLFTLLLAAYTNDHSYDETCPASAKSMEISGFLGDFEIVKMDFMYFTAMCLTYLTAEIVERIFLHDPKYLSANDLVLREQLFAKAKKIQHKMTEISNLSWNITIATCVVIGLGQLYPVKHFADSVLHHDLEIIKDVTSYLGGNFSLPNNSTYTELSNAICPYDNFTAIALAEEIYLRNFNLSDLLNATIPLRLVNNHTLAYEYAPKCLDHDIFSLYFYNIPNVASGCDPILVTRTIAAFIGLYWLGISFSTGSTYMLSTAMLLLVWAGDTVKNFFENEPEEEKDDEYVDFSDLDNVDSRIYCRRASAVNIEAHNRPRTSQFGRVCNFFTCRSNSDSSAVVSSRNYRPR